MTTTKTPFEENLERQLTRDVNQNQLTTTGQTGSQSLTGRQGTVSNQLSGLQDQSLLNPLTNFLDNQTLDPKNQQLIEGLIDQRAGETTPAGYRSARDQLARDYNKTVNAAQHRGYGIGRGGAGSFGDRSNRMANEAFSRGLFDAYDQSQNERDKNLIGLTGAANQNQFDLAKRYSDLVASTPFDRKVAGDKTTDQQRDVETESNAIRNLQNLLRDTTDETSKKHGFRTQVDVTPGGASPFSQLLGAGTTLAGIYAGNPGAFAGLLGGANYGPGDSMDPGRFDLRTMQGAV